PLARGAPLLQSEEGELGEPAAGSARPGAALRLRVARARLAVERPMAPSRGRARAPRGWSLLGGLLALRLWPPPRATAQDIYSPEDPALCAFVRLQGGAAAAAEEATAEALRATWAADARFLRAAAGEEHFWQHLGTDDE
ncbi:unnamed protein product, partial [Prorocentrum cordatum]